MTEKIVFITEEEDTGKRLDLFIAESLGITRTKAQTLIKKEKVNWISTKQIKSGMAIPAGGIHIEVESESPAEIKIEAENIPLDILFENKDLIVINKPAGMVVHPDNVYKNGTLVNAVLGYLKDKKLSKAGGIMRPGVVHRLDKDTSGTIVMAKNDKTHVYLADLFALRQTEKTYLALVHGIPKHQSATIDAPISRSPHNRQKMWIATSNKQGKIAISHYKIQEIFKDTALLEVKIETGRTHQIRVHLASIGYPIVGDDKYNRAKDDDKLEKRLKTKIPRIFLHAERLSFTLPGDKEKSTFTAPLAEDLYDFLKIVEK